MLTCSTICTVVRDNSIIVAIEGEAKVIVPKPEIE